eukprot:CAMPEP_0116126416 /NCGR_PEP_ID=MMETSP0329-20121206/6321_1 /TAXON_ID=697910 /ORGANISM="Pseudo-nitzschia arenysensis, Strain B593" /LENGTH=280 /DNA_ID=CAMNT_0003620499 /DNA_START=79 /DNA_END=921 /DNA_ORIENTATION=-
MNQKNALLTLLSLAAGASAVREVQFVSPLQSLTIPDPEHVEKHPENEMGALETPRRRFLPRFLAGLQAENTVREQIAMGRINTSADDDVDVSGKDWVGKTKAVNLLDYWIEQTPRNPFPGTARPKPSGAKWSVRLLHVNKDAIVKDLFDQGKVDIFAKYTNTGKFQIKGEGENAKPTSIPIVTSKYESKRSIKNLFNFSPKHFFTDSSGAYWRERRLRPGMYTDGETVYESSYRYRDGRNGMHKVSTLKQFLASSSVARKDKEGILKKLKEAAPDVVLEL